MDPRVSDSNTRLLTALVSSNRGTREPQGLQPEEAASPDPFPRCPHRGADSLAKRSPSPSCPHLQVHLCQRRGLARNFSQGRQAARPLDPGGAFWGALLGAEGLPFWELRAQVGAGPRSGAPRYRVTWAVCESGALKALPGPPAARLTFGGLERRAGWTRVREDARPASQPSPLPA